MKIADISFKSPVQTLGRHDVRGPLVRANKEASLSNAIASAFKGAGDIAQDVYNRHAQMDVDREAASMIDAEATILKEHEGRKSYDRTEVPDDLSGVGEESYGPGGRPGNIPIAAYEIRPEIMKRERMAALDISVSRIRDKDRARDFRVDSEELINSKYLLDLKKSRVEQIEVRREQQEAVIDTFVNNGNAEAARIIADQYEGTPEERVELQRGIDIGEEILQYERAMLVNDVVEMQRSMDYLMSDEYTGSLEVPERESWADKFEREIYRRQKADREALKEANQRILQHGSKVRDALKTGLGVNEKLYQTALNAVEDIDPALAIEMRAWHKHGKEIAYWARRPKEERATYVTALKSQTVEMQDPNNVIMVDKMDQAFKEMAVQQDKNTASYGINHGMTKRVQFDTKNLAATVNLLNINDRTLSNQLGYTTGPMEADQTEQLTNLILGASQNDAQTANLFGAIESGAGPDSYKFYEQLQMEKKVPAISVAGQVFRDDPNASINIVRGNRLRTKYPKVLREINTDLREEIDDKLGSVYRFSPKKHSAMVEAIIGSYVNQMFLPGQEVDITPESVDDEMVNNAINEVTGGLSMVHDKPVESAYRGQPEGELEDYFTRIKVPTIEQMGNPAGFTSKQIQQEMANNTEYVNTGKNKYALFHIPSNAYIFNKDGSLFEVRYLETADLELTTTQKLAREAQNFSMEKLRQGIIEAPTETLELLRQIDLNKVGTKIREKVVEPLRKRKKRIQKEIKEKTGGVGGTKGRGTSYKHMDLSPKNRKVMEEFLGFD